MRNYREIIYVLVLIVVFLPGCATNMAQNSETTQQDSVDRLTKDADTLFIKQAYEDALVKYVNIVSIDPKNDRAFTQIGVIHDHLKSYSLSAKAYQNALSINENNISAKEGLGIALMKQGYREEAKSILQNVVELEPQRWKAHNCLGIIYDMEQLHAKAAKHFREALTYSNENAEILNNLGYSYYLSGDLTKAEQYFLQSIKSSSNFERAWSNLGLLYSRESKYAESLTAFSNFMQLHEAHNQVGYLSMLSGDYDVSELHFKKAILTAPHYYETAHKNMGRLKILKTSLQ